MTSRISSPQLSLFPNLGVDITGELQAHPQSESASLQRPTPVTFRFPNQLSYLERLNHKNWPGFVGGLWESIFTEHPFDLRSSVVEIAPGERSSVGIGLQKIGFTGSIYVVDPEPSALRKVTAQYSHLLPNSRIIAIDKTLGDSLSELPQNIGALISNNPLDDMILGKSLTNEKLREFFEKCYDQKPADAVRKSWEKLDRHIALVQKIMNEIRDEWKQAYDRTQPELFAISQYESNFLRLNGISAADRRAEALLRLMSPDYGREELTDSDFYPPQGGVYDPKRWLIQHKPKQVQQPSPISESITENTEKKFPIEKIKVLQIEIVPHQARENLNRALSAIEQAKAEGKTVLVLPKNVLTGSYLGDRLENESQMREIFSYTEKLRQASKGIVLIFGQIELDGIGKDGNLGKHISAYVFQDGKAVTNGIFPGWTRQSILADYRGRRENRHFLGLTDFAHRQKMNIEDVHRPFHITVGGEKYKIALFLGDDVWNEHSGIDPVSFYRKHKVDLAVHLSSSVYTEQKIQKREQILNRVHSELGVPVVFANSVSLENTENNFYVTDGSSQIRDANGVVIEQSPFLAPVFSHFPPTPHVPKVTLNDEIDLKLHVMGFALRRVFSRGALVMMSGGIDSNFAYALGATFLGGGYMHGISFPTHHNSQKTRDYARHVAENTGGYFSEYAIEDYIQKLETDLPQIVFTREAEVRQFILNDLTHQNDQARMRGLILQSLSQMSGLLIMNTNCFPENVFGYGAQHGNWIGALAPFGDVDKEDIETMALRLNQWWDREILPLDMIFMPSTTELEDGQIQPFDRIYHSKLGRAFLRMTPLSTSLRDPEKILEAYLKNPHELETHLGIPQGHLSKLFPTVSNFIVDLEDKWRRFHVTNYKRSIMPPLLVLSRRSIGIEHEVSQSQEVPYTTKYRDMRAAHMQ